MHQAVGEALKRRAAEQAADEIMEGMVVGLGTGSTVRHLLDVIAERRRDGRLTDIRCIPTSRDTASRATTLGIPLTTLEAHPTIDVTIDGADEVDPRLDLVKGLGGALLREKIVAAASRRFIVIVDESKLVNRLGTKAPLPVEVDCFGSSTHPAFFRSLGAEPTLRRTAEGEPFLTDGGNHIFDCRFVHGIGNAAALEQELNRRPGIIESGLFVAMADQVIVAAGTGNRLLERPVIQGVT